jgi:hypothetical protein
MIWYGGYQILFHGAQGICEEYPGGVLFCKILE